MYVPSIWDYLAQGIGQAQETWQSIRERQLAEEERKRAETLQGLQLIMQQWGLGGVKAEAVNQFVEANRQRLPGSMQGFRAQKLQPELRNDIVDPPPTYIPLSAAFGTPIGPVERVPKSMVTPDDQLERAGLMTNAQRNSQYYAARGQAQQNELNSIRLDAARREEAEAASPHATAARGVDRIDRIISTTGPGVVDRLINKDHRPDHRPERQSDRRHRRARLRLRRQQPAGLLRLDDGGRDVPHLPSPDRHLQGPLPLQHESLQLRVGQQRSTPEQALPVPVQAGAITPGIDAQLDNWTDVQGFIHGHVTDPDGNPLNGVSVTAYDSAGLNVYGGGTGSNGTGEYTIGRLRPGLYKVYFSVAASPGSYVSEYYQDALLIGDADPVQVQTGQTTDNIDVQLAFAGTISGRVTDSSGNGISGVNVFAVDTDSDRYSYVTTNAVGNYTISRLLPDTYKIRFRAEIGDWATEGFDGKSDFTAGDAVTLGPGQVLENINVPPGSLP